ncbi:MAG: DUF1003 domain-containing protein [Candidatus Aenigmarchaeota archaeon]|nr:DUF1003 domain-containing protein [Candidatus Aenigmarchaeota archaeon]NIP40738.1 DUF1003 domain-containing protein [Candidatus Aenigmarchaeota archaeon]NIQ18544.1 DUF1003 domain-containing protein [Candidatus Aenigmarchaeota archaeon]NIS73443.1 DUF1003 domain-containing protein [Candidatus Aenigmarchaeota archaeon]
MEKPNQKPPAKKLTKHEIAKKIVKEDEKQQVLKEIMRGTKQRTFGQKSADWMTEWVGSWTFIVLLFIFMAIWMTLNIYMVIYRWDPYPFILLNFVLSCLAAIQAPIILMSQKRQTDRDRVKAEHDYRINRKAELEIEDMQKDLEIIKQLIRGTKK